MGEEFDIRDLPSWKHFVWGLFNGLVLGIIIKHGVDISEGGIASMILKAFKPIFQDLNISAGWITLLIILLWVVGLISLIAEIYAIYEKGWSQRIIAGSGFLSFLFLVVGIDTLGIIFLFLGVAMVLIFPDD